MSLSRNVWGLGWGDSLVVTPIARGWQSCGLGSIFNVASSPNVWLLGWDDLKVGLSWESWGFKIHYVVVVNVCVYVCVCVSF